nr:hypothetical protein [Candidatus Freyarchaeota archaeon]
MKFELSNGHNIELVSEGNEERVLFDGKEVAKKLIPSAAFSLSRSYDFKIEVSREGKKIKYDKYQLKIFGKVKGVMKQMFHPFKMPEIEWRAQVFCNGKKVYSG